MVEHSSRSGSVQDGILLTRAASLLAAPETCSPDRFGNFPVLSEKFSNALLTFAIEQDILWTFLDADDRYLKAHGRADTLETNQSVVSVLKTQSKDNADKLAEQLRNCLRILTTRCEPLLLKGACFIAEEDFKPQYWRFMCDFDFLVDECLLRGCVDALEAGGYRSLQSDYSISIDKHYPLMMKEGWPTGVELHTRCLRWPVQGLLDATELRKNATIMESEVGRFLIPSCNDRIIHLVLHAQLGSNFYRRRVFRLRDAVDFTKLCTSGEPDLDVVHDRFIRAELEDHFLAFVRACEQVTGFSWYPAVKYSKRHSLWAETALKGLEKPETLKVYHIADWMRLGLSVFANPGRWRGAVFSVTNRQRVKRHLERIVRQWRNLNSG
ncbi:nucleotidyltransferase family protein [Hoeflea sp. CAU 1731]